MQTGVMALGEGRVAVLAAAGLLHAVVCIAGEEATCPLHSTDVRRKTPLTPTGQDSVN